MLTPVPLVYQWWAIQRSLPEGWADARLRLTLRRPVDSERAAALLGPVNPGRRGAVFSFHARRRGAGPAPDFIWRLLAKLDAERIEGELELLGIGESAAQPEAAHRPTFVEAWSAELGSLPDDWSDLYVELELDSSDYLEPGALLLAPVNPARHGRLPAFRYRVARRFGYGASTEMARRCLERLDRAGIRGNVRVLRALSDTRPVQTQGPVWYVGGRSV
jgi:hypothetical protein